MKDTFIVMGVLVVLLLAWFIFRGSGTKPVDDEPEDK